MNVQTVDWGSARASRAIADSLRDTGFVVLNATPLEPDLIREVYGDWELFFASETKHRYERRQGGQQGYFPFKSENAKGHGAKDLKEFFHLYPQTDLPAGVGEETRDLYEALGDLGLEILRRIEGELPQETRASLSQSLVEMGRDSSQTLLRILHYPPVNGQDGEVRAAAHEDINLITLLPAATEPGLQVRDNSGNWHCVACDPGSVVVNVGDMLQVASRRYFRSTTHRVVNPVGEAAAKSRYSMPLFVHPRPEVELADGFTAERYLRERLHEIGLLA